MTARILIIDDDRELCAWLEKIFEPFYRTDTALEVAINLPCPSP